MPSVEQVIGTDPYRLSATIEVVDQSEGLLGSLLLDQTAVRRQRAVTSSDV